jgi:hypothetical protein
LAESISRRLGKYAIIAEIGKGGFATVYRAHDPDLDRVIALKVLDPLLTRDPVWVARFRREARAVAKLDHPHVLTIHEVGQAEGMLYIAMRLVEGGNLAQRIADQGALPWDDVVRLVGEIASALDCAHEQGIVHRDLKAANVLLDEERGALLTDFGFARMVAESSFSVSISGGVVGTPQYIAPEVWHGKPASSQTDVYALGCILYEMVVGAHLFQGDTTPAVMMAHFQPLELPEEWPQKVPPGLGDVLQTALTKEPEARYARAGELAEAVGALKVDHLAEPYALLEAALVAEDWPGAVKLAGKIREEHPDYRDVVALEEKALDGLEQAARKREAATWRIAAEKALTDGNRPGAEMAARQWQALTPDDPELANFQKRLGRAEDVPAQAAPAEPSSIERAKPDQAGKPEPRKLPERLRQREPTTAPTARTTPYRAPGSPAATRTVPSHDGSGIRISLGVLIAGALLLVILSAIVTNAIVAGGPTPEPVVIVETVFVEREPEVVVERVEVEVTRVVEVEAEPVTVVEMVEVEVTRIIEVEVERVVTATPRPLP